MNRLRDMRAASGLTMRDIGRKLGVTQMSVSRYEREEERMNVTVLRKFARIYGVRVSQILGEEPWPDISQPAPDQIDPAALTRAVEAVDQFTNGLSRPLLPAERASLYASFYRHAS